MRKPLILLLTLLVMASCSDPNAKYVKKAVRIMDKHGIYAQGPDWEKAKQEVFSAKPSSLDEAQEVVIGVTRFYGSVATLVADQDFFLLSTVIFPFSLRLMEQTRKAKNGDKRIRERISGCN